MVQEKLKSENKSLQANLSRVMERMDTMRTENEDLRNNLDKANAQVVTTICSFERQELDYRGKIARLEEQVRQMQLEYTDPEMSKRGKQLPIVKRFVDTLGRIRELETSKWTCPWSSHYNIIMFLSKFTLSVLHGMIITKLHTPIS